MNHISRFPISKQYHNILRRRTSRKNHYPWVFCYAIYIYLPLQI